MNRTKIESLHSGESNKVWHHRVPGYRLSPEIIKKLIQNYANNLKCADGIGEKIYG